MYPIDLYLSLQDHQSCYEEVNISVYECIYVCTCILGAGLRASDPGRHSNRQSSRGIATSNLEQLFHLRTRNQLVTRGAGGGGN